MVRYTLSTEESKRIDIAKLISVLFVVFIHSYTTKLDFQGSSVEVFHPLWLDTLEYGLSEIVASCGVPLFFLFSSILFYRKQRAYFPTLKAKARTLLVPYLFWNTLWIIAFAILQSIPSTAVYFSGSRTLIRDCGLIDWLHLYGIGFSDPQVFTFWFVRDMMVVLLFFPIISRLSQKFPKTLMAAALILLFLPFDFPLKEALLWNITGACLVELNLRMKDLDRIPLGLLFSAYFVSILILLILHHYEDAVSFLVTSPFATLNILLGILFWVRLTKYIYGRQTLQTRFLQMAQYTFIIYAAHELTLTSIKKVCLKLLPQPPIIQLLEYLLLPSVMIAGCVILGMILKKYVPKFYAVITGGRG